MALQAPKSTNTKAPDGPKKRAAGDGARVYGFKSNMGRVNEPIGQQSEMGRFVRVFDSTRLDHVHNMLGVCYKHAEPTSRRLQHHTHTHLLKHDKHTMADAITWKCVSREQVELLAQRHSVDDCKSELAQIFKLDGDADTNEKTNSYLLDCYLYSYSFARQQHLRADQISVLLGILHCLMVADFGYESTTTITSSYAHFQSLLLAHSVDRPPKSVQIFSAPDVTSIVDFVAHSYYRHFHLYKCIFTPFYHTHLVQKHTDGVQLPPLPRPLSDAFLHPQPPQPPQDTQPADQDTHPQVEATSES